MCTSKSTLSAIKERIPLNELEHILPIQIAVEFFFQNFI